MLELLIGLYKSARDPVLIQRDSEIIYRNPAAVQISEQIQLPEEFYDQSVPFIGALSLYETEYQVTASAAGDYRVYVLYKIENSNKTLLASMGASLKDSVTTIQMATNMLKNTDEGAASQHYQNVLSHQLHSINRLAGNMLHLGGAGYHPDSDFVKLVELYGNLVHSVNVLTNGNRAVVEFIPAVNDLDIPGSSILLEKMLLNLLSNSLKATPIDGKITVSVDRRGDKAIIIVKDNGKGIPEDILPSLFSSYDVERKLSDRYQSIGMGLSVVQDIVRSMGGAVVAKSEKEKGTVVTISLPIPKNSDTLLRSPSTKYATNGMKLLQTELCDVLTADCYGEIFSD